VSLVDRLAPPSLGSAFRWIWASSAASNLGDGIVLAASPLLVASLTRSPLLVALSVFLQQLPWLLFGFVAGAYVDRVDRRRLTIGVDVLRAVVLLVLAGTVATGMVSIAVVLVVAFLLGSAETLADNAAGTLVATAVPAERLGVANARLFGTGIVTNQLAGPPLGAFLFAAAHGLPFAADAACYLLAAVLVSRIRLPVTERDGTASSLRREVAEGLRWLWAHAPVRTLALTITLFNVTFAAAMSVWVLYARERLGLGDVGFGLIVTCGAVGGLVGSATYRWLEQRFSLATLMRVGLTLETLTHLGLALTRSPWVAGAIMTLFGVHAVVWGTTSTTVRQRAVPQRLLGRVTSVYLLGAIGGSAVGTLLGGAIGQRFGVVAPYWFGFVGSAVLTVAVWRSLTHIVHAAEDGSA
jgi:MFS family permease